MSAAATPERQHRQARPPARPAFAATIALSGRTYADLASAVGCTPATVGRIVNGTVQPSAALRARLAAALGVDDVDGLFALSAPLQRLVDEAIAAGVNTCDDTAADRLVAILAGAAKRPRPAPAA